MKNPLNILRLCHLGKKDPNIAFVVCRVLVSIPSLCILQNSAEQNVEASPEHECDFKLAQMSKSQKRFPL